MNGNNPGNFEPTFEEYMARMDEDDLWELMTYGDNDEAADEEWYAELTAGYYRDIGARR